MDCDLPLTSGLWFSCGQVGCDLLNGLRFTCGEVGCGLPLEKWAVIYLWTSGL